MTDRPRHLLLGLIGSLVIMYAALYNGYPLVTGDTASYILSGFKLYIPTDRPPFYGLFLHTTSIGISLWLTVFVQSLLLTFLLYRTCRLVYAHGSPGYFVTSFVLITTFTCVSWVASYLMADIFTGILALTLILYLFSGAGKWIRLCYLGVAGISVLMHNSHFLIALIFSVGVVVIGVARREGAILKKGLWLTAMATGCWIFMCGLNFVRHGEFTLSRNGHVFIMGRLVETGLLKSYLDEKCASENYPLCKYKNELPAHAIEFIWSPGSPLYKTGGWDSSKKEYGHIIHDIFTTRTYLFRFTEQSILSTGKQLMQVTVSAPVTLHLGEMPQPYIQQYFPQENERYLAGKQSAGKIRTDILNAIWIIFFVSTMLFVLWYVPRQGDRNKLVAIYCALLLLILLNAFTTATFANVLDRLQNRIFWLLPALNAMLLARYLYEESSKGEVLPDDGAAKK